MGFVSFLRTTKYNLLKKGDQLRTLCKGYDKYSRIEKGCKLSGVTLEGRNHIGKDCTVYRTKMGFGSGVSRDSYIDSVLMGRFSTFGPDVKIITGQHPTKEFVSTYPAFYSARAQMGFTYVSENKIEEFRYAEPKEKYKVVVGNDVWVGSYTRIVEGVTIGDGAIVAAGSIVTKDVPPYAIVGGVPAKIIRYRFTEEEIQKLLAIRWWDKDEAWLKEHAESFESVERFIKEQEQV